MITNIYKHYQPNGRGPFPVRYVTLYSNLTIVLITAHFAHNGNNYKPNQNKQSVIPTLDADQQYGEERILS